MSAKNTYRLPIWLDLRAQLAERQAVRLSTGPQRELYAIAGPPSAPEPGQAAPQTICAFSGADLRQRSIQTRLWAPGGLLCQPLPGDRLLLAQPRAGGAPNGEIWGADGRLERALMLGDGLISLQTSASGQIWAGYFDEGIFGNRGWLHPGGGISGLMAFDLHGKIVYQLAHAEHIPLVTDHCTINVISPRELWCFYEHRYNSHPLVRIQDGEAAMVWDLSDGGYYEFAIWQNYLLARYYYSKPDEYHLFEIKPNGRPKLLATHRLLDHAGEPLATSAVASRGDRFYLAQAGFVYCVGVQELVDRV